MKESPMKKFGLWAGIVILLIWSLFPVWWMLITSVKTNKEIFASTPTLFPKEIIFSQYQAMFNHSKFFVYLKNSIIITGAVTIISIIVGALSAYSLTRFGFPGRGWIARLIVMVYLLPASLLFIPLFRIVNELQVSDTLFAAIFTYLVFTVPFCSWMMMSYFKSIPVEIEEAARVDGSGRLTILFRIIMPLSLPGMAAVALYSFTLAWNEFILALVLLTSESNWTLPIGIQGFVLGDNFLWGQLMAMSTLACIPPFLLYILIQRYVVGGFLIGSVKG